VDVGCSDCRFVRENDERSRLKMSPEKTGCEDHANFAVGHLSNDKYVVMHFAIPISKFVRVSVFPLSFLCLNNAGPISVQ